MHYVFLPHETHEQELLAGIKSYIALFPGSNHLRLHESQRIQQGPENEASPIVHHSATHTPYSQPHSQAPSHA